MIFVMNGGCRLATQCAKGESRFLLIFVILLIIKLFPEHSKIAIARRCIYRSEDRNTIATMTR